MTTKGLKRKLAAILSADVKGYSRLMGEDEDRNDFLTKLGLPGRGLR
jgi:class 3 adenylate cyclase